jgi:signal peptidase I
LEPANSYEYPDAAAASPYTTPAPVSDVAPPHDALPPMPEVGAQQIKPGGWGNTARELVETVLLTLVIFFMIRFAVENYRIEGYSMEPNFHDGEFLLVSKINYLIGDPDRGDVIVFHYPQDPKKNFIKRVIGLPGEKVQIKSGKLFINDARVPEPYPYNVADYDWGPVTIGPDEYFVLGDNRPESSDSHAWGMLPKKLIIGKAWVSYWPPGEWGAVHEYSYAAPPPASAAQ